MELLVTVAIVGILAGVALPGISASLTQSKVTQAEQDIVAIETGIAQFTVATHVLPVSLADIRMLNRRDPWGTPYQYLSFEGALGGQRTDHNHMPVNSDYDLYSAGPDGNSVPRLTNQVSRDDIIRAADGGFVGRVADYRGARGVD